jgi:hypothetical protein
MVFARGDPGDERAHASFHAATLDAPAFRVRACHGSLYQKSPRPA